MHIGGKKRTERLDDERPVIISHMPDGTPIWTEAGDSKMRGDDKAALAANLRVQQRHAVVLKAMRQVQETAAAFLEVSLLEVAPQEVLTDYKAFTTGQGDGAVFADWLTRSGFGFKQDGLRSVFLYKGRVLKELHAKVDAAISTDVVQMLRFDSSLTVIEQAAK